MYRPHRVAGRWAGRCAKRRMSPSLGAGVNAFFCSVSHSQRVKIHEDLLKMRGFQCIGGGSVPPHRVAARWAGRCAKRRVALALAEAPMHFFVSYHVGKMLKSVKVCLKCLVFNALGAAMCRPQSVAGRWAGRSCQKARRLPWHGGLNAFFCLVSGLECVGKCVGNDCVPKMHCEQCIRTETKGQC